MLYDTIWYDTMTEDMTEEFNVDSKLSDQINLANVTRKKYKKEETKTNKRQCPLSPVQVQDPWRQSRRIAFTVTMLLKVFNLNLNGLIFFSAAHDSTRHEVYEGVDRISVSAVANCW